MSLREEPYLFACMRYIELNPVRAGMVSTASEYRWSSYHFNAESQEDKLITEHKLYLSLGPDRQARNQAYRSLFQAHMADNITEEIRAAWQTGTPLANERFKEQIEKTLNARIGYPRRGRPKKKS